MFAIFNLFLLYALCKICCYVSFKLKSYWKSHEKKVCFDISFHSHQQDKTKSSETGLSTQQRLANISEWMFGHFCRVFVSFCKTIEMPIIVSPGSINA